MIYIPMYVMYATTNQVRSVSEKFKFRLSKFSFEDFQFYFDGLNAQMIIYGFYSKVNEIF